MTPQAPFRITPPWSPQDNAPFAQRRLFTLLMIGMGLAGVHLLLTIFRPTATNIALAAIDVLAFASLSSVYLLMRWGRLMAASILLMVQILVTTVLGTLVSPYAATAIIVIGFAIAATSMPIVPVRAAVGIAISAGLGASIAFVRVVVLLIDAAQPSPAGVVLASLVGVLTIIVTMSMLVSYRVWAERTIMQSEQHADALRMARDELDRRVAERTEALSVELARSRAIAERLQMLDSVAHNARDAILILEPAAGENRGRRILYVSPGFARLTGYCEAEAVGASLRLLRSPTTSLLDLERVRAALDSGRGLDIEIENRRKDGSLFWAEQSIVPARDQEGEIKHWVVVLRDVTQDRALRETLWRRNHLLEAINETTLALVGRQSKQDILRRLLDRACKLANTEHGVIDILEEGNILVSVPAGVFRELPPRPRSGPRGALAMALATREPVFIDDYQAWPQRLKAPGFERVASAIVAPILDGDVAVGAIGLAYLDRRHPATPELVDLLRRLAAVAAVALDNSQLHTSVQAERDLALQITNSMGQGLAVFDSAGVIQFINPSLRTWLGDVRAEAALGQPLDGLFEPAGEPLPLAQDGVVDTVSAERCLKKASGEELFCLVSLSARLRAGVADGGVAVITDVTTAKQTELALEQARDRAQVASRLKSEFLAMMSHEIRTPLNAVLGMTELLLDTPLDAHQRELTKISFESSQALLTVINDILDFSRIEAGKLELVHEPFSIQETARRTVEMLRQRADEKGLFLDLRVDRSVPTFVVGDAGRLRQVLVNLVGNAVKFTDHGGVVVSVDLLEEAADHVVVRCATQDSGIGLSAAVKARLFQPFTQADSFMTRRQGGTGLGLAICRRIVELMGGEIHAEGEEGDGATFWFTARFDRT